MYNPWNLGGLNPSFFVIWGGLAPPSPYVEPPLLGLAPAYLRDLCCPTPGIRGRSSLRSMEQRLFFVPFAGTSTLPKPRPVHSRWLAPLCGMGFLWHNDCSPGFFPTHSTLASKLFFLVCYVMLCYV